MSLIFVFRGLYSAQNGQRGPALHWVIFKSGRLLPLVKPSKFFSCKTIPFIGHFTVKAWFLLLFLSISLLELAFRWNLELMELLLKNEELEKQLTKEDIDTAGSMLRDNLKKI